MPTASELDALTPMMRQYHELKQRAGDAILFFRMGDFYEIFGSDAEEVAPFLELVLTSRERGDEKRIPFCGVPHLSARNYWLKLLKKGYKVALADQVEDPAEAKGLVRRDIIRVMTPGVIDDPDALELDAPNYLLAAYEEPTSGQWAVCVADLSTGELRLGNVEGLAGVRQAVESFRPKELLARRFVADELSQELAAYRADQPLLLSPLPEGALRDQAEQRRLFGEVFGKDEIAFQPCGATSGGEPLVAAVLLHVRSLQASLSQFLSVRPLYEPNTMTLDETAVRDLELFQTVRRRDAAGSLFHEINCTLSPMGARLLRYALAHPLLDPSQVRGRHAAVRSLLNLGETRLSDARTQLKNLPDLERLAARAGSGAAAPAELAKLTLALDAARWILEHLTGEKGEILAVDLGKAVATGLKFHRSPFKILTAALEPTARSLGTGSGVFRAGFDAELDRLNDLARSGEDQVEAYQEQLRARTGIGSLKIKSHKSYGLLIEVTRTHTAKVPADFIRRQTMVNCDRFVTVELTELDEVLASAQEKAVVRELELYRGLLAELAKFRMDLRSVAQAMATLDLMQSFAWQALKQGYCEPRIPDDDRLDLKSSRHPVVERAIGRHAFAPNDVVITPKKKHLLITGPNMAGKSTVMRQTALCAILSQIGSFVPAQSARLPVFDRIFTRVGAADDLARGQSTFMVEMSETASILRHATQKSLVILDEVGRGTSTRDGLAIAAAILSELALRIRCYSLFATHYHELVPFAGTLPSVRTMATEVIEQDERIIFTHRLKDGAADSSYGLEVARLAGVPQSVLTRAAAYLAEHDLESVSAVPLATGSDVSGPRKGASATAAEAALLTRPIAAAPLERHGLTTPAGRDLGVARSPGDDLLERLKKLNINRMTPIQALNFIAELQADLGRPEVASLFPEESC